MDNNEIQFLKEITDIEATSGNEEAVRDYLREKYQGVADTMETDGMGSLMTTLEGEGPRILAVGHMDEVGFIVRGITESGYVKFARCGYFFVTGVLAQHFTIQTDKGPVNAICTYGQKPNSEKFPDIYDLVMDIGCKSKAEAKEMGVQIGDFIVPKGNFQQLGPEGKLLVNKAWDNRIGCAVALRVMENLKKDGHPNTFIGGGSVQEEVGCRGAKTLGYKAEADIAFSIDVGLADDMPGEANEGIVMGNGPELCYMDNMTISNRKLLKFCAKVAEECGIPYQVSIQKIGGTDSSEFQGSRSGMPVLLVNVPSRYAHTPVSVIHYDDYINTIKLMTEVIKRLDAKTVAEIRTF